MAVLFLCVANSARSQLAAGLARRALGEAGSVQSAGSAPTTVHPAAVAVMAEIGVDLSQATSRSVADVDPSSVDTVVTLCTEEVCPAFLGDVRRLRWPTPDPAAGDPSPEATLARFRVARDTIAARVAAFARAERAILRPAEPADAGPVRALLASRGLDPSVELAEGVVVAALDQRVVGVAAVVPVGAEGLLRSVAVAADLAGSGLAQRLVADRVAWAGARGIGALTLLTTGARSFFEREGFRETDRAALSPAMRSSSQFSDAGCASAACLVRAVGARSAG